MRPFFFSLTTLALTALPAIACLNDRESLKAEREFKSQYQEKPGAPAASPSEEPSTNDLLTYGGIGGGALLIVGALALGVVKTRQG